METNLWQECLYCKDKCCNWSVACPLFLTEQEKQKIKGVDSNPNFNKKHPCTFLDKNELCSIHSIRPTDCKFFPFDVMEISGDLFRVVWDVNCSILNKEDFEPYLQEFEVESIPKFKEYLKDYAKFRLEEFLRQYKFKVIRKINFL